MSVIDAGSVTRTVSAGLWLHPEKAGRSRFRQPLLPSTRQQRFACAHLLSTHPTWSPTPYPTTTSSRCAFAREVSKASDQDCTAGRRAGNSDPRAYRRFGAHPSKPRHGAQHDLHDFGRRNRCRERDRMGFSRGEISTTIPASTTP